MMATRTLKPGVHAVGVLDWDKPRFDDLIPLPDGTSYNAYLVKGQDKVALLDTVEPAFRDELFANLAAAGVTKLDYVIAHHAEQDHSGCLPAVLARFPGAKLVTNQKCADLLKMHVHLPVESMTLIKDGDTLDLGGRTLRFIFAPWVHWPETMFTHLREDKILFTCDFLGSHRATSDLFADDEQQAYAAAKRYYAEIMMPFRLRLGSYIEKIEALGLDMIAPSHGPVYRRPAFILDAHKDWIGDKPKNHAVVAYVSMHGSTKILVDRLVDQLIERGVTVTRINLPTMDLGHMAMALVDAATIVLGSSTVLAGPHPAAVYAAYVANMLRPKARFATVIGSLGWGGKTVETLKGLLGNLKAEFLDPIEVKGMPGEPELRAIDALAASIQAKHANL
jgi:flavorubredoxin